MNYRITITIGFLLVYCPVIAFFLFISLWNSKWLLFGLLCIFSPIMFRVTQKILKKETFSRFATATGAVLLWAAYGILLFRRVLFIIQEGGMERRDGYGSPLAFLIGMVTEVLLLALPAIAFTLLAVFCSAKKTMNSIKTEFE